MNQPIKLSIAATSKRVDIASVVGLSFFNNVQLPRTSQLDIAMGWRDSELGGTGPAILVDKKKYDFGFGNPVGLSRMAYLGCGFYKKKIPLRAIGVFPTWDRLIFAVRKDSGIQSIEDIKKQKYPLRSSRKSLKPTAFAFPTSNAGAVKSWKHRVRVARSAGLRFAPERPMLSLTKG